MSRTKWFVVVIGLVCAIAGVVALRAAPRNNAESADNTVGEKSAKPASAAKKAEKETNDARFHAQLLKLAAGYQRFGRVDDERRLAPTLCRSPRRAELRLSKSDEEGTHGRKLYYLYAKDRSAYLEVAKAKAKPGQAIVKQSWHAEAVTLTGSERASSTSVAKNAKHYRAVKQGPLFIMYKTGADTTETDKGWVYGTVSSDGKTVTSAGRVASCMACHQDAPHGRLFGLQ